MQEQGSEYVFEQYSYKGKIKMKKLFFFFLVIVSCMANNIGFGDEGSSAGLVLAAYNGNLEEVQRLVNGGASVNSQMPGMMTPALTVACSQRHFHVAEFLVSRGANVNLKAATDETPLMAASAGGLIKIVHLLLEKGAQLNEICKRGMTALHYAVNNGHYIISQMLIKKGIDKTIKIQNKYDALYIAKNKKQYALMRLLNGELDNLSFIKLKNLVETAKLIKGKLYQIKTKIIGMLPNGKLFIPVFADEDSGRKLLLMGKISPDLLSSLHPLQKIRDYLVTFEMFAMAGDKVIASFTDISIPTD